MALRILFAGTPQAAVPALERLADDFEVVAVLTRPDAARGRGRKLEPSAVKQAAERRGIPVLEMKPSSPEFFEAVRMYKPDIAAVVAYGRILRENVLESVPLGWLNLHFSLLPQWRGAAPVQRAIWAGDTTTGVSVFRLDKGMDTGRLIARQPYAISGEPTSGELMAALADFGAGVYADAFHTVQKAWESNGRQPGGPVDDLFFPQKELDDPSRGIATKITHEDARADIRLAAAELSAHIRACDPDPGAWTVLYPSGLSDKAAEEGTGVRSAEGERLRLDAVRTVAPDDSALASWCASTGTSLAQVPAGRLLVSKKHVWLVPADAGKRGVVELLRVTAAGKKMMRAADWARGAHLGSEACCA